MGTISIQVIIIRRELNTIQKEPNRPTLSLHQEIPFLLTSMQLARWILQVLHQNTEHFSPI